MRIRFTGSDSGTPEVWARPIVRLKGFPVELREGAIVEVRSCNGTDPLLPLGCMATVTRNARGETLLQTANRTLSLGGLPPTAIGEVTTRWWRPWDYHRKPTPRTACKAVCARI